MLHVHVQRTGMTHGARGAWGAWGVGQGPWGGVGRTPLAPPSRRLATPPLTIPLSIPLIPSLALHSRVAWLPVDLASQALAAPFLAIDMHAVQGATSDGPGPCVYLQLSCEGDDGGAGPANGHDDDDDEDDEDDSASPPIGEVRLVPADPSDVDALFGAMCECAALNPDPSAPGEGPGGGGGPDGSDDLFFDSEAAAAGAAAARLDALLVDDPARFEDPPDDEGEERQ